MTAAYIFLFLLATLVAMLWILVPFFILGTNKRLDRILKSVEAQEQLALSRHAEAGK